MLSTHSVTGSQREVVVVVGKVVIEHGGGVGESSGLQVS